MSIRVACPKCGHAFKLANNLAGKKIRCTECEAVVPVPVADEEAAPSDRPRSRPSAKTSSPRADRADADESPAPRKRKGIREDKRRPARTTGGKGVSLWIAGAGVLLLLVLIGGGITGGIVFFRNRSPSTERLVAGGGVDKLPTGGGGIAVAKLLRKWDVANDPGTRMEFRTGGVVKIFKETAGVEKEESSGTYRIEGDSLIASFPQGGGKEESLKIKRLTDDECVIADPRGPSDLVLRRPGFTGGERVATTETINELKTIGFGYQNYLENNRRLPGNSDEFSPFLDTTKLREAVKNGTYVVYWNVDLTKLPAGTSNTVLAFEKETPTKGGLVLMADVVVKMMTADEFKKAAKPPGH